MLKSLCSTLLLSAGFIVGVGADTVSLDAELSTQEHQNKRIERTYLQRRNTPSRSVALTGKSQLKIKPSSSGRTTSYEEAAPLSQNPINSHNWFPSQHLPDKAGIAPVFFGSAVNYNLPPMGQDSFASGDSSGFPSDINAPYFGTPFYGDSARRNSIVNKETPSGGVPVPTPEPGTMLIVGSGLIALCYKYLRKR